MRSRMPGMPTPKRALSEKESRGGRRRPWPKSVISRVTTEFSRRRRILAVALPEWR